MRKSYVTIEDMGTDRQNPPREDYYVSSPMHATMQQHSNWSSASGEYETGEAYTAPVYNKGRTPISDVESRPTRDRPVQQFMQQLSQQPVFRAPPAYPLSGQCADIAAHVAECPLCSRIYEDATAHDVTMYVFVIAILVAVIVAMFVLRKR